MTYWSRNAAGFSFGHAALQFSNELIVVSGLAISGLRKGSPRRAFCNISSFDFVTSILLEKTTDAELQRSEPPYSIFPGDVALAFNNESPVTGQASQQFALPSYAGFPENGRTIRWQVSYATAPSAVTIQLQTAMNDEDAQYAIPTGATNMTTSLTSCDILSCQACRRISCAPK